MRARTKVTRTWLATGVVASMMLALAGSARATTPVKLIFEDFYGKAVNAETGGDVCSKALYAQDKCQPGVVSTAPGGYEFPSSVAGAANGNVYVADKGNHRLQELTATGEFVLMFGREVNETKSLEGAPQAERDLCTEEEIQNGAKCRAGVASGAPGEFDKPASVAVDPISGDIYVAENVFGAGVYGQRVQKLSPSGQFIYELGKEVNETTKGNLCTLEDEENGEKCGPPAMRAIGSPYEWGSEQGAFNLAIGNGDLLTVDGTAGILYVADEGRVQEFKGDGQPNGEIPLASLGDFVSGVAFDAEAAELFAVYGNSNVVHVFNTSNAELRSFEVGPSQPEPPIAILAVAIDAQGHVAIGGLQSGNIPFGSLYTASSGHFLTSFTVPVPNMVGLTFNGKGEMYGAASGGGQEILAYAPQLVAEVVTQGAACSVGTRQETDVTLNCLLHGFVDPENVLETEVWFEWGSGGTLGKSTPHQPISAAEVVSAPIVMRPNDELDYRLAGEDAHVKAPEKLTGEVASIVSPLVPPVIVSRPVALYVKSTSAVFFDALNPENGTTRYLFEYGPGEAVSKCADVHEVCFVAPRVECTGVTVTQAGQSSAYGDVPAILEAVGLQPDTVYHFRLYAESENSTKSERCATTSPLEGEFTTSPAPEPIGITGGASNVTPTSAIVHGEVDPRGLDTTFAFEVGVDKGAETQYGVVDSGSIDDSPAEESFYLTGLQPGTEYAYRISVTHGALGGLRPIVGQAAKFLTPSLPTSFEVPPPTVLLPVPPIGMPSRIAVKGHGCKHRHGRRGHGCAHHGAKRRSRRSGGHGGP
jgi:NHL repeat